MKARCHCPKATTRTIGWSEKTSNLNENSPTQNLHESEHSNRRVDYLENAEDSIEYWENSRNGLVAQLEQAHKLITVARDRIDDSIALTLLNKALLKIEAQLNY